MAWVVTELAALVKRKEDKGRRRESSGERGGGRSVILINFL